MNARHTKYASHMVFSRQPCSIKWPKWRMFALASLLCFQCLLSIAQQKNAQYSDFKKFLSSSRPPIKLVKFTRSALYYSLNGKPIANDIWYEASVQSNTYYIKQESTFKPGSTNFNLTGLSHDDFWHIGEAGQISMASRNINIAGTNTPPEQLNNQRSDDLEETLDLGIIYLDRKTISWSGTSFIAQPREVNWGMIKGHITDGDGVHPNSIEYKFSNVDDIIYKAIYRYDNDTNRPDWIPHFIILSVTSPHYTPQANAMMITNSIQELDFGMTKVGSQGYEYTDFVSAGDSLTNGNLVIYSNGFGKVLIGTNFETVSVGGGTVISKPGNIWKVRLAIFAFLAFSFIGFGWYMIRCHSISKGSNNKRNHN